jgi:hypothetical protein
MLCGPPGLLGGGRGWHVTVALQHHHGDIQGQFFFTAMFREIKDCFSLPLYVVQIVRPPASN